MNKYKQIKTLGQGGFGKAILASVKNGKKEEKVVIKEVQLFSLKPQDRDAALQEAKLLSKLKYPFIVSYVESFQERGHLYIVMEYADGGDLSQKIEELKNKRTRSKNLLSEEHVLNYFIQIALAIKYIHDRKILHRDLKTQNIFLMRDGTVKLGDFGIAKVLQNTMQNCRTQIGTPYYLSPEICEGKNYNAKTDIWSLGCILYELCTLRRAFDANNMNQLIMGIIRGKHKPIDTTFYGNDLRYLVDSMLIKDPSRRPSINQILRLPFIKERLNSFLDETFLKYEMAHTILHSRQPLADPTIILADHIEQEDKGNKPKEVNEVKPVNNIKESDKRAPIKKVDINRQFVPKRDLVETRNMIENEKMKLSAGQQVKLEYEDMLQKAKERRERRLQQEKEDRERQLREQRIHEQVKRSVQENHERELIRLPQQKKRDEIDLDERRRIFLEQKRAMLRNKQRYQSDQESIFRDVYGDNSPPTPARNVQSPNKNAPSPPPRNIQSPDINRRPVTKRTNSNDNHSEDIDMNEFFRQQRREARANKLKQEAALGLRNEEKIDMDKLINDAEKEIINNQQADPRHTPISIRKAKSRMEFKKRKQKDIPIEFLGTPKVDLSNENNQVETPVKPTFEQINDSNVPKQRPKTGFGTPKSTRSSKDQGDINEIEQEESETEQTMKSEIDKASAIMDAFELPTEEEEESQSHKNTSKRNDFDNGETIPLVINDVTMDFPIVKDSDSLAYRAEAIRAFLEKEIGMDELIKLYQIISNASERDDQYVDQVIADSKLSPPLFLLIQQLVVLDEENC